MPDKTTVGLQQMCVVIQLATNTLRRVSVLLTLMAALLK